MVRLGLLLLNVCQFAEDYQSSVDSEPLKAPSIFFGEWIPLDFVLDTDVYGVSRAVEGWYRVMFYTSKSSISIEFSDNTREVVVLHEEFGDFFFEDEVLIGEFFGLGREA